MGKINYSGEPDSCNCGALPTPHSHIETDGRSHNIRPDIPMKDSQDWLDVLGYEGLYEVSSMGYIRSKRGVLKPSKTNTGYYRVSLASKGKSKNASVHRTVALAFVPNPLGLPAVNHKDGNKLNNAASNLEWVTYQQNTHHARDNGLLNPPTGKRHSNGRKTHCNRGHELAGTNMIVTPMGWRQCKKCRNIKQNERRQELRNKFNDKYKED